MDRQDILDIRDVAASMHATGSSPLFPANGAGQLAYQYGTRELRATHLKRGWVIDQSYGTNGVRHPDRKIVVLYQNVDVACSLSDLPQARSRKGAGSERLSQGSAFDLIEEVVPSTYAGEGLDVEVWYVMVAQDGAVEVTHALIRGASSPISSNASSCTMEAILILLKMTAHWMMTPLTLTSRSHGNDHARTL
ncbi:MAG: hypothetical protein GYB53_24000 [Rhodobacteraceae bacterium]|nr:hypothetical protein [Paracoccaceae bacterium]